jgi:peptide/nickel transport system permease protein
MTRDNPIPKDAPAESLTVPTQPNFLRRIWLKLRSYPLIPVFVLLVLLVIPALTADWLAPHDPIFGTIADRRQPPVFFGGTWEYPLGTDRLGRDVLSRIMFGARVSLSISLVGIFVGGLIGVSLGLIAGYLRGWIDTVIMRLVEISLALPAILLALVLAAATGPSFKTIIIVVAFVLWALYARQVRGEVLSIRERDYVARARVAGASHFRIIVRHILPNVANTIIVLATLQVGSVIILEASLSFLGLGIPRPTPAWGLMVADGRQLIVSAWWISFFPGLAITLTVFSLNLLGDWLRDRLDPRVVQV